jgi:hypothetical protein
MQPRNPKTHRAKFEGSKRLKIVLTLGTALAVLATKPTPRLTRHTNATSAVYRPFVIQSISLPVPRWEQIDPWRLESAR